ncbi:MAG: patatin-like phospholipase family protein, partial [Burkholderiales bacterium]
ALAQAHLHELPRAVQHTLRSIGAHQGSGAAVASYLLFEPGFIQALMALGEHDAFQQRKQLLAFVASQPLAQASTAQHSIPAKDSPERSV